jgi:hypothetical protein
MPDHFYTRNNCKVLLDLAHFGFWEGLNLRLNCSWQKKLFGQI